MFSFPSFCQNYKINLDKSKNRFLILKMYFWEMQTTSKLDIEVLVALNFEYRAN